MKPFCYFLYRIITMDNESRLPREEDLVWKQIGSLQTEMPNAVQHESEVRYLRAMKKGFVYENKVLV